MKVKFEFERKKINFIQFCNELESFLDDSIYEGYRGPIIENEYRLYKDKAFVYLIHRFTKVSQSIDEMLREPYSDSDALNECIMNATRDEYDSLVCLISEML